MGDGAAKSGWVNRFPVGESTRDGLARLVDEDTDSAEVEYYEAAADPELVALERAPRRYRGRFRRRLRHLKSRSENP